MESDLSQSFKEAVARWLRSKGFDVATVTGWDEYNEGYTGCDTCDYGSRENEISIFYRDSNDRSARYIHYGRFGDLLSELLDA